MPWETRNEQNLPIPSPSLEDHVPPKFWWFSQTAVEIRLLCVKSFPTTLNGSNMPSIQGDMIVQRYQKTGASPVTGRQLFATGLLGAFQTKLRYSVDSIHKAYRDQNTRPLPGKPSRAACRCHGKPATGKTSPYHPHLWRTICCPNFGGFHKRSYNSYALCLKLSNDP